MKRQLLNVILLCLCSVIVITACGADSRSQKGANSEALPPSSSNTPPVASSPTQFQPGILFDLPPGADSDEQAVISVVESAMKAMVVKDKVAFRATLKSPDENYFDFLIDTPRQFKFTELKLIEPYDESTGRKNIHIHMQYLENGEVSELEYIFTSRKGKDGKWRIANID